MSNYTIAVGANYKEVAERLCIRLNTDRKSLVESMLIYFDTLKVNPEDIKLKSFENQFAEFKRENQKIRDLFVSFIREQEKKKLNPLIEQMNEVSISLLKFLKEDALTKKDLTFLNTPSYNVRRDDALLSEQSQINENTPNTDIIKQEPISNDSKALDIATKANLLFEDMIEKGQKAFGRGLSFEPHQINHYREQFKNLKKLV